MKLAGYACEHPTIAGKPCAICATHFRREVITIYVPDGYKDAREFLRDCQFEEVRQRPADAWTITCRNKWRERLSFAWALMFRWPYQQTTALKAGDGK